jgi:hypothetical protein
LKTGDLVKIPRIGPLKSTTEARNRENERNFVDGDHAESIAIACDQNMKFAGCISLYGTRTFRPWYGHVNSFSMSLFHKILSRRRNLSQLAGTVRQVLASNSNETVHVNGWVKSVRVQKNIAFAMIHDGTTQKGLQVVFRNPTDAKVSVCLPR